MLTLDLPGLRKLRSGKVREVFEIDERHLLFVATDRLSAFDVVLADPIPNKGAVLTRLSAFWFDKFAAKGIASHFVTTNVVGFSATLEPYAEILAGRSMIVERTEPLPVECVVRGYLAGSGWKEYRDTGKVCGITLPAGLQQADALAEPIFTPAHKAETGHDENITWDQCRDAIGIEAAEFVRWRSTEVYALGSAHARRCGILIADTKFEFGRRANGSVILIDECLTPDSSRFWPADSYKPGISPPSFDKQFVRDWLESQPWDKTPPAPRLPEAVLEGTAARYIEAYERITGSSFAAA
ncbi:phosphoribosylaminoimidazolesuccinocarboxamide synthase [Verrucomicrobia bacterium SCGC AG-212-E04]|nr:phosphoribosylaminoimidazolesuccinocarboxamide synthase [Verrucomicrobia bacterium SCGC AG-212-E04]